MIKVYTRKEKKNFIFRENLSLLIVAITMF